RVGGDRRAVHQERDAAGIDPVGEQVLQRVQHRERRVARVGRHLGAAQRAGLLLDGDDIGERSPGIDAHQPHARMSSRTPRRIAPPSNALRAAVQRGGCLVGFRILLYVFAKRGKTSGRKAMTIIRGAVAVAMTLALFTGTAPAEELVRIGLAVPHNAAYVQFYAAETLGFYKEAGVKTEITIYRGGAASQEAMSAGAADIITYFGAGVGLAVSKGAKEKIVAAVDPTPHGWHFLVLASSPIRSLKDLDGKKIGVATKAGTADMFALWIADKGGARVQTIPVGGGGMVPALRAGQVDAIAMFPGLSLQLVASGEARSLMDIGKEMEPTL